MIQKQELLDLAADFGLQPNVVEKDYVLGWLLAGIRALMAQPAPANRPIGFTADLTGKPAKR